MLGTLELFSLCSKVISISFASGQTLLKVPVIAWEYPWSCLFSLFMKFWTKYLLIHCGSTADKPGAADHPSNGSAIRCGCMSIKPPSWVSHKTGKVVHGVRFLRGPLRSGLNTLSSVSGSLRGARFPVTLPNEGSLRVQHVTVGTGRPEPSTFN